MQNAVDIHQLQQHPLITPQLAPIPVCCALRLLQAARSVQRRRSKQKKQQQKAEQAWQNQIDQKTVRYQVTIPPTDPLISAPPQFFDPEPSYQQQDLLMNEFSPYPPLPLKAQAYWSSSGGSLPELQQPMQSPADGNRPRTAPQQNLARQQQQQRRRQQPGWQSGPGPVKGPEVPAGALWVEDRRSVREQQQFQLQQRRRQGKHKPQGYSTEGELVVMACWGNWQSLPLLQQALVAVLPVVVATMSKICSLTSKTQLCPQGLHVVRR
jgi:hypothetical protein